jgi:hypothetical protein
MTDRAEFDELARMIRAECPTDTARRLLAVLDATLAGHAEYCEQHGYHRGREHCPDCGGPASWTTAGEAWR